MLASMTSVSTEQALLAGLIHNIGALPILVIAEDDDDLFNNDEALTEVIQSVEGRVGKLILESWKFAPEFIDAVTMCYQFDRKHDSNADLTDIIQVALLQGGFADGRNGADDWSNIQAFEKLGMDTEINAIDIEENQAMIEETKSALMV